MNNMPNTPEQIEANRKFVAAEYNRIHKITSANGLVACCIIYWSKMVGQLESRVGYFESNIDAQIWAEEMRKTYTKYDTTFEIYYC